MKIKVNHKLLYLGSITTIIYLIISSYSMVAPYTPTGHTGAPGEELCVRCHSGIANSGSDSVLFSISDSIYKPDSVYTITLQVLGDGKATFGFQSTVLDTADSSAGTFELTDTSNTSLGHNVTTNRSYVSHFFASSNNQWEFTWIAPGSEIGPIVFYYAGNVADGSGDQSGDEIYTGSYTIFPENTPDDTTTGIKSVSQVNGLTIFPNPSSDEAKIRFDNPEKEFYGITLFNDMGQEIFQYNNKFDQGSSSEVEIDLRPFPAGIYFIKVGFGNSFSIKKLVHF